MLRRKVFRLTPLLLSVLLYRCVGTNPAIPGDDADTSGDATLDPDVVGQTEAGEDALAPDAMDPLDASTPTPCNPMGRFTSVQPVLGVNTPAREGTVHLTFDELTIFFSRSTLLPDGATPIGSMDIYKATRASRSDSFGIPVAVATLNSDVSEAALSLDPAGSIAYFVREPDRHVFPDGGSNPNHGFYTARLSSGNDFSDVRRSTLGFASNFVGGISVGQVSRDIYYASHQHIYLLSWDTTNSVFRPTQLVEPIADASLVNQPYTGGNGYQGGPMLSRDEKALYFSRAAPTNGIHVAVRGVQAFSAARRFTEIEPLGVNNSGPWISSDQCRLYFSSDRSGNFDLYVATRAPE